MKTIFRTGGAALLACLPLLAAAQASPNQTPKAAPPLNYRSAFADYKPYKDEPPADWRKVNDAVAPANGGMRGYAGLSMDGMQGRSPMPPAGAASSTALKPQPDMPMHGHQHRPGSQP